MKLLPSIFRAAPLLFLLSMPLFSGCEKEKHCLDCETLLVQRTWIVRDTVRVAKMEGERGFCSKKGMDEAREKKERIQERAAHHRELLRAFADTNYNGFYTGERSIDSEEDLHSMLKNPRGSHPFIIRIEACDSYTESY